MTNKTSPHIAEEKTVDRAVETAIKLFDWFSDPENFEVDNRNTAFFSFERARRGLNLEVSELRDGLQVFKAKTTILGKRFSDPVRQRELYPIDPEWVRGKNRGRLLLILKPQPYVDTFIPFGPARLLQTTHANIDGILMTFKEGDVVRDESIIRVLPANVLAKLNQDSVVMCADRHCQHRFDLSESVASDVPVFEVLKMAEVQINHDGRLWFYPGDWVKDSAHRYFLAKPDMQGQYKDVLKEVTSKQYTCCPKCKNIAKRIAPQPEKTVGENQNSL